MSAASLISQGYGGYAGWGDAEADADFAAGHGEGKRTSGGTSGTSDRFVGTIDESQIPSVESYTKGQFATEDVALQALIQRMEGREKPLDIFERLEGEAGLPALRGVGTTLTGEIYKIEDVLENLEPQLKSTTLESLITQGQFQGMLQEKSKPFRENLAKLSKSLGRISSRISDAERMVLAKVGMIIQGEGYELESHQLLYATQVDRNSRLVSGFSSRLALAFIALMTAPLTWSYLVGVVVPFGSFSIQDLTVASLWVALPYLLFAL